MAYPVNFTGPVIWTNFIKIDAETGKLTVNHNDMPGTKREVIYENMWIVAETKGKKFGQKKMVFNFTVPDVNKAPYFLKTPETIKLKVY